MYADWLSSALPQKCVAPGSNSGQNNSTGTGGNKQHTIGGPLPELTQNCLLLPTPVQCVIHQNTQHVAT